MDIFEYVQNKLNLEYISDIRVKCKNYQDILLDIIEDLREKFPEKDIKEFMKYIQNVVND